MERERRGADHARLGAYLGVLAVPNRLDLLRQLQVPKTLQEIRLAPSRRSDVGSPERAISRQAIARHLGALGRLGLVATRSGRREGRPVTEFQLDHARLFVIAEDLGRLTAMAPAHSGLDTAGRFTATALGPPPLPEGPALLVANGPLQGSAFALSGPGPWTVGRRRGVDAQVAFDPFASQEHCRVHHAATGWELEALAQARNGTRINWRPTAPGSRVPVRGGDAIIVGRTTLILRGV